MKKIYLSIIVLLTCSLGWGQYTVDFDGASDATNASAYGFTDKDLSGITWSGVSMIIPTTPLAADWFNGTRSLRSRGYGNSEFTMTSDKANGIGTISFNYRRYGTDTQVAHRVEYSTDGGSTWTQAGSDFTGTATVESFNGTVNVSGNARVRITTVSATGTSNRRLNIDDIVITDFTGVSDTQVQFTSATGSVAENGGTFDLVLEIANEDAAATSVDVALTTGNPTDVNNYTTQTLTFPSSSSANQTLTLTITDNMIADGDRDLTFTLQNPSGGNNAQIGTQNTFVLTIIDNDLPTAAIPYNEDFSNCATQDWSIFTVGAEQEWSCDANGYFEANAFGSSGAADDYLVSPTFDMDAQTNEVLTFTSWTRFADATSPQIVLLYTDNFSGDPATTTWNSSLSPTWPAPDSQTNTGSGNVDVSGISGTNVVFAFRYTSTGTGAGSTEAWRIEDFAITTASTPSITLSETTLSGLDYVDGSGPSVEQSFTVEGTNLSGDITLTAPTNFEISTTSGSGFGSSVALTPSSGSVSTTVIYVRLADGLSVNTYNGTLTATSTGAIQQEVSLSGVVSAPSCAGTSTTFPFNGVSGSTNLEHTSSNPPLTGGDESCGLNYLIYYTTAPSTDTTLNYLRSNAVDGLIESSDWGGEGKFETFAIDVSGETSIDIQTLGNTTGIGFNTGGEEFQWWYTLDGGTQINLGSAISGTGSLAVGPTTIDVTGVNEIIVGFTFNMNGGSDGFENVDVTVTATPTAPEVGFDTASSTVNETNTTFTVNIPVTLSNFSSNVDLSVTVDGSSTAEAGDYTLNTTALSFSGNGTQNISLDINPDADFDDETIILTIAETTSTGITITTSQHTLTIIDDETAPLGWQITATNTAFIIDFDATIAGVNVDQFNGTGFTPTPATGQLNSNAWEVTGFSDGSVAYGGTASSGDFARGQSLGGTTTGGIFAFEVATGNVGLGVQSGGSDFTPGSFTLRVQNQTGETITDVDLSYLVYVYNDQDRASSFNFSYSEDDSNYTPVAALDLTSPEAAGTPEWVSNPRSTSLTGLSLNAGEFLYLRWTGDDVSGAGSRDEFALDDISVTFLPPSVTFTYDAGSWTPNDPIVGPVVSGDTDDVEVLNGTAVLSGELIANNLTINAGAVLEMAAPTSALPADASLLNLAGNITNNGTLIFKSGANGSAQLGVFNGSITGSGNVTVERFIPAFDNINGTNLGRAFRILTSTVTTTTSIKDNWQEGVNNTGTNFATDNQNPNPGYGIHITGSTTGANGFDATGSGESSMFTLNNATTTWAAVPNTDTETLLAGRAYRTFVRGDRSINVTLNSATPTNTTLRSTGQLRTGTVNYGADVVALSAAPFQVSLVANPYQAVVDYVAVSRTNLTNFIAVWDASINDRGGYVSVDLTDPSNTIPSSSDASRYLAPGQAFFVRNTFSPTSSYSITFEEEDKVTDQEQVTVFNTNTDFKIISSLYRTENLLTDGGVSDGLVLAFNDNYTTEAGIEDAQKLANPDENYAVSNNGLQAIDKQAMPSMGHEVNLFINGYVDTNYTLTFAIQHQPDGLGVFLQDAYLQTQVELTPDFSYDFSIDESIPASTASNRFSLHFDTTTLGVEEHVLDSTFSIFPNPSQGGQFSLQTHAFDADELEVAIYTLLGQQVFTERLSAENNGLIKVDAPNLSAGMYLVEISQDGHRFTQKLMVE